MKKILVLIIGLVGLVWSLYAEPMLVTKWQESTSIKTETQTTHAVKESFGEWVPEKSFRLKVIYEYDRKGNLVTMKEASLLPDNSTFSETLYKYWYDDTGNVTGKDMYGGLHGKLGWKTTYVYDEKGNMAEENNYDSNGKLTSKYSYTYDEDNNNSYQSIHKYETDGTERLLTTVIRDKGNNTIIKLHWSTNGSLSYTTTITHDSQGNKTEESEHDFNGLLKRNSKYTYDDKGNLIKVVEYDSNDREGPIRLVLNDDGKWIKESKEPFNLEYGYIYKYDSKGNWVERYKGNFVTKFGDTYPEPYEVTIRKITYY